MQENQLEHFISIAQKRKTIKVLSDNSFQYESKLSKKDIEKIIQASHEVAFHFPSDPNTRGDLTSIVPWRFYLLDGKECKTLAQKLETIRNDENDRKVTAAQRMLDCAEGMVITSWLPPITQIPPKPALRNEEGFPSLDKVENIAAASAATQNLLLSITAAGLNSYWYTGGVLRSNSEVWNWLNITSPQELMLGAIMIFPSEENLDATYKVGSLRDAKGPISDWYKWINL